MICVTCCMPHHRTPNSQIHFNSRTYTYNSRDDRHRSIAFEKLTFPIYPLLVSILISMESLKKKFLQKKQWEVHTLTHDVHSNQVWTWTWCPQFYPEFYANNQSLIPSRQRYAVNLGRCALIHEVVAPPAYLDKVGESRSTFLWDPKRLCQKSLLCLCRPICLAYSTTILSSYWDPLVIPMPFC